MPTTANGLRRGLRLSSAEVLSRAIATRVDGTLYYVHSDHPSASLRAGLGSTVAVSDAAGQAVGRVQEVQRTRGIERTLGCASA